MAESVSPVPSGHADFTRDRRVLVLTLLAVVTGAASTVLAKALLWLINALTNLCLNLRFDSSPATAAHYRIGLFILVVPALGGLIVGCMARYGSPQIRGHGIPEALEAILIGQSRMDPKVTLLKPLSSAISIGTGGPFGAEGPIIVTGGALGSLFAQRFMLSAAERKTLLVAGAAGGMAAVFAAPVSAVLLAIEVLLFEWRPRSLIPVAASAATAAALRLALIGPAPVFPAKLPEALPAAAMLPAIEVGLVAGLAAMVLTQLVYGVEDAFRKLPLHWMWWPVLGGIVVGVGGLICPRALGVGYDTIDDLLRGSLGIRLLLVLLVTKAVIWSVALGSGTSGGVLAPLLIIGGALGAAESRFFAVGTSGTWALVGMAAAMGGTLRAPLTAVLFALEATHAAGFLPVLLVGCTAAYAVTVILMPHSILTEKVARRGLHLSMEYGVDPLGRALVHDVMDSDPPMVRASVTVAELASRLAGGDPALSRAGLSVVDDDDRLLGILTRRDLFRVLGTGRAEEVTVLDACTRDPEVAYPDERLPDALARMMARDIGRLPVVSRDDPRRLVGYLGRANVIAARQQFLAEETVPGQGWIRRP